MMNHTRRRAILFLLIPALLATSAGLCPAKTGNGVPASIDIKLPTGPHPYVFLTPGMAEWVRRRPQTDPWADPIAAKIIKEADSLVAETLDIPHKGGGWSHWYTCKVDGARLRPESPTRHVCPVCGRVYTGEPYDSVYVTMRHNHWLNGVATLGMAYTLDPKPEYARRVRQILLEYAGFYSDLRLHDVYGKQSSAKARLFAQTLNEGVIACPIVFGYDQVYDAPCFSAADHEAIANGLLRPMVETIRANDRGLSNWQTWHNAGVCAIGLLLRDRGYVDWSVNGRSGLLFQLGQGSVLDSGMWYEESPDYHFYALDALADQMEALDRSGMNLYKLPIVRKLFEAPVRQLLPDFTFAPMQDSNRDSIRRERRFYEVAYREYRDPIFAELTLPRDDWWALFRGADKLPNVEAPLRFATSNSKSEGLAILRDDNDQTALLFDYGPGGTGHVHPAKLNVVLYAGGDIRFTDAGRIAYGNPMYRKWFRQTVAHDTVVVNGTSQKRTHGTLRAFASTKEFDVVRAMCDTAYHGVTLDRTVFRSGDVFLDIVQCTADKDSVFDLPLHIHGAITWLKKGAAVDSLGNKDGYSYLKDIQELGKIPQQFDVDLGGGSRMHVTTADNSTAFRGTCFAPESLTRFDPFFLRRQKGKKAVFMASYEILKRGERRGPTFKFALRDGPAISFGHFRLVARKTTRVEYIDQFDHVVRAFEIGLGGAKAVPVTPTPTFSR